MIFTTVLPNHWSILWFIVTKFPYKTTLFCLISHFWCYFIYRQQFNKPKFVSVAKRVGTLLQRMKQNFNRFIASVTNIMSSLAIVSYVPNSLFVYSSWFEQTHFFFMLIAWRQNLNNGDPIKLQDQLKMKKKLNALWCYCTDFYLFNRSIDLLFGYIGKMYRKYL